MTVDASRSCLGLGTCVGSSTRQIVDARVLLTATAPPALPGSSVSGGSLAPPCDAITGFLRSARCRRHAPSDGPNKACQLTGDRGSDVLGQQNCSPTRLSAALRQTGMSVINAPG